MTSTPATPRTIDPDVFRRARRAGATLPLAAYVARPPVIDLDWRTGDAGTEWNDYATFEVDGRTFRALGIDIDGCESCAELVQAWRDQDENIAWMTDDEYDATTHRGLMVTELDENGDELGDASLYGVCGSTATETDRRADERYVAETVVELAREAAHATDAMRAARLERLARQNAEQDAERRRVVLELSGVAVAHGARPSDDLLAGFRRVLGYAEPRTLTFHSTIHGEEGPVTMSVQEGGNDFPPQTFPV